MNPENYITLFSSIKYEFDGGSPFDGICTFSDLIRIHKQWVDDDYLFWDWFNDLVASDIIKPLI